MRNIQVGLLATVLSIVFLSSLFFTATADYTLVVKTGDWIDYKTVVTGTPNTPNNVTGATVNFTSVEGTVMHLYVVTKYANGSRGPQNVTLNLQTGILGDDFVIPINMNVDDQFYDINQGNITISSIGTLMIAGAQRTVVSANVSPTVYYWDRETGVLVMANSTNTNPAFEMDTTMTTTNIWQPTARAAPWYEQTSSYIAIGIIVLLVVLVTAVVFVLRKRRKC
jgi:hypothetical protein